MLDNHMLLGHTRHRQGSRALCGSAWLGRKPGYAEVNRGTVTSADYRPKPLTPLRTQPSRSKISVRDNDLQDKIPALSVGPPLPKWGSNREWCCKWSGPRSPLLRVVLRGAGPSRYQYPESPICRNPGKRATSKTHGNSNSEYASTLKK